MKIKKLIVYKLAPSKELIREIEFNKRGLSLIVDNTPIEARESGNSIGKTTVIKVIDLCLGAKSVRELYFDADTKSENVEVRDFLKKHKVQAELVLTDDTKEYSIKRDLYQRGKRYIEGEAYKEDVFWEKLKEIIFQLKEPNPTFRQLIPKFVRLVNTAEDSMIKFLPAMTKNDVYDTVYSFLFQICSNELLSKKSEINAKLAQSRDIIQALEKSKSIPSLSVLKQSLNIINNDLQELSVQRDKLSYMDEYRKELDTKRQLTVQMNNLQEQMELLEFEIDNMENSLSGLSAEKAEINFQTLKSIYQEAERFIPQLQKNFEDMVVFHNSMIQNRIDFIKEQLDERKQLLAQYSKQLTDILKQKEKIAVEVLDEGLLDELNTLNHKIEEMTMEKGEIIKSIQVLEEQEAICKKLGQELTNIEQKAERSEVVEEKLKKFNAIFADYCNKLYGEKYLLAYNQNWKEEKNFPVTVASLGGNVGRGKKKAIIVAFDLAYMQYGIQMGMKIPQFVIHDKMENTHINQIKTIFEICESIDGQYIIPILRERIDSLDQNIIEKAKVLELSTEDKFFRI